MTPTHQAKPVPSHDTHEPRKQVAPVAVPAKRDPRDQRSKADESDDRELPFTD
jgi:hypothetical protein